MVCPKCNTVLKDNASICPFCGTRQAKRDSNTNQTANNTESKATYNNTYEYPQDVPPQAEKKKSRKWILFLVLGICAFLIVAIITVIVAGLVIFGIVADNMSISSFSDVVEMVEDFLPGNKVAVDHDEPEESEPEPVPGADAEYEDTTPEAEAEPEYEEAESAVEEDPGYEEAEPVDEAESEYEETEAEADAVYEETEAEAEPEPEPVTNSRLVIATGGLHLRSQPDSGSKSKGVIPDGSIITISGESDGWVYTYYGGKYGWCSAEFLFVPKDYDYSALYSARVTAKSGIELTVQDHMVGTRNAKTTVPYDYIVYVYSVSGDRAFVSYNNIYGWCDTTYLQRRY